MMPMMPTLKVSDLTTTPGGRYAACGPYSGEWFRDEYLIPCLERYGDQFILDLDGVMGYALSWLEEVFGGAVRRGVNVEHLETVVANAICQDESAYIDEIRGLMYDMTSRYAHKNYFE